MSYSFERKIWDGVCNECAVLDLNARIKYHTRCKEYLEDTNCPLGTDTNRHRYHEEALLECIMHALTR